MKKIYIYVNDCIRWSGGLNILIQLISAVNSNKKLEFELIYVKPSLDKKIINFFRLVLRGGSYKVNKLIDNDLFDKFQEYVNNNNLTINNYSYKEFKNKKIDEYLFPVMKVNSSLKAKNLFGYIPDCQHLHLTELFLKRVIWYRNYQFRKVKKYCAKVLSTSKSVKEDLINSYNFTEEQIITLGFNPIRFEENTKFNKPAYDNYFLIANQLWEHKNHTFAIKAFKDFIDNNPESNTKLLCTGYLHDHRNISHNNKLLNLIKNLNLEEKIIFLGYLSRDEFLNYLTYANAVVQPTLFEGTPGGLSAADSVSYGVDVFLSDIKVNKEVDKGTLYYFDINKLSSLSKLYESSIKVDIVERLEKSKELSESSKDRYSNLIYQNLPTIEKHEEKKNIIIDVTSFTKWAGGTRLIYQFIDLLDKNNKCKIFVFDRSQKNFFYYFINLLKYRENYKVQTTQETKLKEALYTKINTYYPNIEIINKLNEIKEDFKVFPLLDLNFKYRKNGIFFIPDIGHKELKENFNLIIRFRRYIQIRLILTFGKYVLVNSRYIGDNLIKNYNFVKAKIVVSPFYGFIPDFESGYIEKNYLNKFTNQKYFIVCNQFWVHKNHLTAIKALKQLNEKSKSNIKLICTGFKIDYRGNDHVEEITKYINENNLINDIIFTDFLDRKELLNLINNSIALVQPSIYEGGPGGFSSADAISLNKKVIISDIKINSEIKKDSRFIFFNPYDPSELSNKMELVIDNQLEEPQGIDYKMPYLSFLNNFIDELFESNSS